MNYLKKKKIAGIFAIVSIQTTIHVLKTLINITYMTMIYTK